MDQVWANRAASAEAAVAKRHLKTALAAAGHPARRRRPGRRPRRTGGSAPGTTGGRRTCWTAWSTRSCATRSPTARDDHAADPGHIACATTAPGPTTTTTTWPGWRWRWSGRAGWPGVEKPRRPEHAVRPVRQRLGARGRRRHPVAQAGPVLQRPGQRPGRHLPGPLRRPAAPRPADGRLDRRHPDRPRDPPGVRRHQGAARWCGRSTPTARAWSSGLETELAVRTGTTRHAERVHRLVAAIDEEMAPDGVHQGRRRRRRRPVRRDHWRATWRWSATDAAGDDARGRRGPGDRPRTSC